MASGNPRWVGVSDSQYAHEREGLAHIKTHLPVALVQHRVSPAGVHQAALRGRPS